MKKYILKRLLILIPTLWIILTINFFIIQLSPGGPVEQIIHELTNTNNISNSGVTNLSISDSVDNNNSSNTNIYEGAKGLDPEIISEIKKIYGFDKPIMERYLEMIKNYLLFDFGESFFRDGATIDLIISRLPISISLGIWVTIAIYLIAIPLGIAKAVRNGSKFDIISSFFIIALYAIPSFSFAILLIELFSKAGVFPIFPLSGLVSDNFSELSLFYKIIDYLSHIILPFFSMVIGGFATLTIMTKNLFLEEFSKSYVLTAQAKGLNNKKILYRHIFRNAMLYIIAGIPGSFITIIFTSSLIIEVIFNLNGLGLLAYEASLQRDYPLIFGTLYIYSFIGLLISILNDIAYNWIDPRINFSKNTN